MYLSIVHCALCESAVGNGNVWHDTFVDNKPNRVITTCRIQQMNIEHKRK